MCSMPSPTHESGVRDVVPSELLTAFGEDLSRYGAVLARWPAKNRLRAEALLAASPEARADLEDARLVEEFLTSRSVISSEVNLAERIFASQRAIDGAGGGRVPRPFFWHSAAMMQAAFIVGVALVGLVSGRWAMSTSTDYDVTGIFMICTDAFYL